MIDLRALFSKYGSRVAITYDDQKITYTELLAYSDDKDQGSLEIIHYDRSLAAIIEIIACFLNDQACLILNRYWPEDFNDVLILHLNGISNQMLQGAVFLPTSGTTGDPKLCKHSFKTILMSAERSLNHNPILSDECYVLSLQPFHMGGLLSIVKPLLAGATLLASNNHWSDWLRIGTNLHLAIVPAQFSTIIQFVEGDAYRDDSFCSILIGGDFISDVIRKKSNHYQLPVIASYGMTETGGQVISTVLGESLIHHHIGQPLDGTQVSLSDSFQLLIQTPTLATHYIQNGVSQLLPTSNGWFETNDIASIDQNGCISIHGRQDHQFNSGGELISPEFIERVLQSSGLIEYVIVIPKQDDHLGFIPIAFIHSMDRLEEIRLFSEQQLPRYMQPKAWFPWPKYIHFSNKASRRQIQSYFNS